MIWRGKNLKTAGEVIDEFVQCQTVEGVREFLKAYEKVCPRATALGNLRFGLNRFYTDGCEENDPRMVKRRSLERMLTEVVR